MDYEGVPLPDIDGKEYDARAVILNVLRYRMSKFYVGLIYLVVHIVVFFGSVILARTLGGVPATDGLTHVQAGLIAAVWHLPLTTFIYCFTGRELGHALGVD